MISTINSYPRNEQLRDPDVTRHKLYHSNQYQYSQSPFRLRESLKVDQFQLP